MYKLLLLILAIPISLNAMSINEAIEYTLTNNPKVKSAYYKSIAEKAQYSQSLSAFLPSINISLTNDLQRDTLSPLGKTLSINQPIFSFGSNIAGYYKAMKSVQVSEISFIKMKQEVILDIVKAYTSVVEQNTINQLREHNVFGMNKHLTAANKRFELGEITQTDLAKSRARLALAISAQIKSAGELSNSHANYIRIVGNKPDQLKEPQDNNSIKLPKSLQKAIELSNVHSLQIKSAQLMQEAARYSRQAAYAKLLPTVSASAAISNSSTSGGQNYNTSAMLTTTITLFRNGSDHLKAKQTQYEFEHSQQNYYEVVNTVKEFVTAAWNNLITTKSIIISSSQEVESASIVLESVKEEEKLNLSTLLDVIDAENDLLSAQVKHMSAKMKYIFALYNLAILTSDIGELISN